MKEPLWTPEFEELLREQLSFLTSGTPVPPDKSLYELGLDSINLVSLALAIEDKYGIDISDALLKEGLFSTAAGLWSVITTLRGPADVS
ncbi:phosphopantetheine-binding protein [Nonomuraea insulae]|uniref:Phosphopantetheine-binding protein n=1 Tax=Nonomuraea insulae TaxID=1616787 RepID=A0ABW1D6R5_9ACTN